VFLVGLTGGIASGKSTVAERLVERGAELIDADEIAREVVLPGTQTWKQIVEHFGEDVLDDDGFIDRPKLGRLVFGNAERRTLLNELTHPPVMAEIANRLEVLALLDSLVVLDVPLLVEAGAERGYDAILVVASNPETQLKRLVELRGMAEDDARARIAAQAPLDDKLAVATHVIWNEGTVQELLRETERVADALWAAAREKATREAEEVPDN
jgi:dephospho-CoA kinase